MKTIIINGRFLTRRITGVERYAREILAELDKIITIGEIVVATPPEVRDIPKYNNIIIEKVGILHDNLWEQISFPLYVVRMKGIGVNLCNTSPIIAPGVVCIHDMKIKARPKDFKFVFLLWYRALFYNACKRAKCIITVSNFSKKEICKFYHVDPERVFIVPNAWQHFDRIGYDEEATQKFGLIKGKYYFSLCSLEPNKNIKWIAEAAGKNPEYVYAVAGAINNRVFSNALKIECPVNLLLLGYVTDEEAKALMRDCKAFIYPSYYEGFGIPPMEAISAGCTNIYVSDIEIMHEIFEDYVNYLEPINPDIIKKCQNINVKDVLKKYSWTKISSPKLLEILRKI